MAAVRSGHGRCADLASRLLSGERWIYVDQQSLLKSGSPSIFIADCRSYQSLHPTLDAIMSDVLKGRFSVYGDLIGRQPFHDLAEAMRPKPLPPLIRIYKTQAELVHADTNVLEPDGLDHLTQGRRSVKVGWNLSNLSAEGHQQVGMPVPSWVTLPPP
jgi:hypothetical protein